MSNHPYEFEPGMVILSETWFGSRVVIDHGANIRAVDEDGNIRNCDAASCLAYLEHAGTRGLLLDQYRKASGHDHAQPARGADGRWRMCPTPFTGDAPTGEGECEGTCILDALTRLTDKRATIEPLPEPQAPIVAYFDHDGRRHRVVVRSGPEPHVAIEWLAAPDALGNERWNSVDMHSEYWDGPVWCEYVALALAKHRSAMRVPADIVTPPEPPKQMPAHADALADLRGRIARIEHAIAAMAHGPLDVLMGDGLDAFGEWIGNRRSLMGGIRETDAAYRERLRFRGHKPPTVLDGLADRVDRVDARVRRIENHAALS